MAKLSPQHRFRAWRDSLKLPPGWPKPACGDGRRAAEGSAAAHPPADRSPPPACRAATAFCGQGPQRAGDLLLRRVQPRRYLRFQARIDQAARPTAAVAGEVDHVSRRARGVDQSPYTFQPRGKCGKMVSSLLPRLGELVDELCFIHSLTSKTSTHGPGELFMSTGFTLDGFPSMGAWVSYALGSETDDLPAYVAIPDPRGVPQSSVANWGPGFLPAVFQGTAFMPSGRWVTSSAPAGISAEADRATRDYLKLLNDRHLERFPGDSELAARISSYELAARMQLSIPRVADLSTEPAHVLKLYGADDPQNVLKAGFARNCILARRLVERGVRFVELFNGAYAMGEGVGNWDGHKTLKQQYDVHGPILDQPAAALLIDLKQRGLLEHTLVVWCTEFGRMPTFQKGASGRDHNPDGFTCWLAGAGVKRAVLLRRNR